MHPEVGAVAVCGRCGTFTCDDCRREPREGAAWCASCAERPDAKGPVGLGGWCTLLGLGFVVRFAQDVYYLGSATWIVASGDSLSLEPANVFELASSVILGAGNVLGLVLFFQRSRRFPPVATIVFFLMLSASMVSGTLAQHSASAGSFGTSCIGPAIWLVYLQKSKRVEATFVR